MTAPPRFSTRWEATGIKPEQVLAPEILNKLRLALATESGATGGDPNEDADPARCAIAERWAAQIVLDYLVLMEIVQRGRGVRVVSPEGRPWQCVASRAVVTDVLNRARGAGVSSTQRVR